MTIQESDDARIDYEQGSLSPSDLDLEPVASEDEDYSSSPADYQITTYPADFSLESLRRKWQDGEIIIPEFRRDFAWGIEQSSKLIESFLVGLPVPPIFVYAEPRSYKFLVMDGQQRLRSILSFIEGTFPNPSGNSRLPFKLCGLSEKSRFLGKTFRDLMWADQRRIEDSVLRLIVIQQLAPDDDTSAFHVFERLNTGGASLSNQEIRNCLYGGSFAEFLGRMNRNSNWRRILGKPETDTRNNDVEILLRFFAMRDILEYRKPMKDFLSRFMRENRDMPDESLYQCEEIFGDTCAKVLESVGEKPFHGRAGVSVSALDAVMVGFSKNLDRVPHDIGDRYESLRRDETFVANTTEGTTDAAVVRERFKQAEAVLFG